MGDHIETLQRRIEQLRLRVADDERIMIAFAGGPGSGKSTISLNLLASLQSKGIYDVAIVPMDGFHTTKAGLAASPDPKTAFARRGAPFTYDAGALVRTFSSLALTKVTPPDAEGQVFKLPSFDHAVQDPVEDDIEVHSSTKVVIFEGNYLLLDQAPWNQIAKMSHDKWLVRVPRDVAKARVARRHIQAGIESCMEAAEQRAEENDLLNADLVTAHLIKPDVILEG